MKSEVLSGDKVELGGKVSSWAERRQAEDIAWSMSGITEVKNKLEIDSGILAD